jgi:hypothetical protein
MKNKYYIEDISCGKIYKKNSDYFLEYENGWHNPTVFIQPITEEQLNRSKISDKEMLKVFKEITVKYRNNSFEDELNS